LNFVFDVGNVLVEYEPVEYLEKLFSDRLLAQKMFETIFKCPEWLLMDMGKLTHDEATVIFCEREPEYTDEIVYAIKNVNRMFNPISGTIEHIPKIKKAGHRIFYLSNIHNEIRDFLMSEHKYFTLFDGGVFSCDVGVIKPSPEIYRYFIDKYSLIPNECLFFDDMTDNVEAAEKEGIKSILFSTADCVLPFI